MECVTFSHLWPPLICLPKGMLNLLLIPVVVVVVEYLSWQDLEVGAKDSLNYN